MNRRPPTEPETPSSSAQGPGSLEGNKLESDRGGRANGPSFEAAIKRLTEIVQTLERGELPLEESLRLFEEGVKLSRFSQQRLDSAEKRVEQLLAVDDQGRARTAPFATDAASPDGDDESGPPF
jgi:exodeoxyribonuclease VII small subunit